MAANVAPITVLHFNHKIGCLKIGNDFIESVSDDFVVVSEPHVPNILWIYGAVDEGLIISQGRVLTRYLPDTFTRNFTTESQVSDPVRHVRIPNLRISCIHMAGSVSIVDIDPRSLNPSTGYTFTLRERSSATFRLSTQKKIYFSLLQSASIIGKEGSKLSDIELSVYGPCRFSGFEIENRIEISGNATPTVNLKVKKDTVIAFDDTGLGSFDTTNISIWDIDVQSFRRIPQFEFLYSSSSEEEESDDEVPGQVLEESQQAHLNSVFPFAGSVDFTESFTLTDDQSSIFQPLFPVTGMISSLCVQAIHAKDITCSICTEHKASVLSSCGCFITCNQCITSFSRLHKTCPLCRKEITHAIAQLVDKDHKSFEITYMSSDRQDKLKTGESDLECDECKTNIPLVLLSCGHKPWCLSCTCKAQLKRAKCSKCHTFVASAILLPFPSS